MKKKVLKSLSRKADPRSGKEPGRFDVIELVPAVLRMEKILVPLDFSKASRKALTYAVPFAEQFGARIVLLHVVEPVVYPATDLGYLAIDETTLIDSAKKTMNQFAKNAIKPRFLERTLVRTGKPHQEIVSTARGLKVDLIVLSTHGYTGLKHAMLGSTAERVVRYAPCPVLIVREQEHEFA
jgi:nucleotide-binding universal stress UspA family protein